jgi:hypothetical protein
MLHKIWWNRQKNEHMTATLVWRSMPRDCAIVYISRKKLTDINLFIMFVKNHSDYFISITSRKGCMRSSMISRSSLDIVFTLRGRSCVSSSWINGLRISDRKFVNHTTEMILWSMILIWVGFLLTSFQKWGSQSQLTRTCFTVLRAFLRHFRIK